MLPAKSFTDPPLLPLPKTEPAAIFTLPAEKGPFRKSPAEIETEPPLAKELEPTFNSMLPDSASTLLPVKTVNEPLPPAEEDPVESFKFPLDCPCGVCIKTSPLISLTPTPELIITSPPSRADCPAEINMFPPVDDFDAPCPA